MTEQMSSSQLPRPNDQTVIAMQKQEIDRINDNRVYLMALLEDTKAEALQEITRLNEEIALLTEPKVEQD